MQHASTNHTGKQIVPEAFNLHVFLANQSEKDENVGANAELDKLAGVFLSRCLQDSTDSDTEANVGEVEQIEQISRCQPE